MTRRHQKRGTMVVETAIMLPLLLLILFVLMEYGWMIFKAQQISNAARHGARVAVRADSTEADVQASVADLMASAGINSYQVNISPPGVDVEPAKTVTVTVKAGYRGGDLELLGITRILDWVFPVPAELGSSVSMAKEGA